MGNALTTPNKYNKKPDLPHFLEILFLRRLMDVVLLKSKIGSDSSSGEKDVEKDPPEERSPSIKDSTVLRCNTSASSKRKRHTSDTVITPQISAA